MVPPLRVGRLVFLSKSPMQEIPRAILLPPPSQLTQRSSARALQGDSDSLIEVARGTRRQAQAPAQAFLTLVDSRREDMVEIKGKQFRFRPYSSRGATDGAAREAERRDDLARAVRDRRHDHHDARAGRHEPVHAGALTRSVADDQVLDDERVRSVDDRDELIRMVNLSPAASSVYQNERPPRLAFGVSRTPELVVTSTPGLTVIDVEPVCDEAQLAAWSTVLCRAFGAPQTFGDAFAELASAVGLGRSSPLHLPPHSSTNLPARLGSPDRDRPH